MVNVKCSTCGREHLGLTMPDGWRLVRVEITEYADDRGTTLDFHATTCSSGCTSRWFAGFDDVLSSLDIEAGRLPV